MISLSLKKKTQPRPLSSLLRASSAREFLADPERAFEAPNSDSFPSNCGPCPELRSPSSCYTCDSCEPLEGHQDSKRWPCTLTDGLLPEQPLLARLSALIESATAAFLDALDDSEKPICTGQPESWQQTVQGHNGPTVINPTVSDIELSGGASQDDDDGSEPAFAPHRKRRLSTPQFQRNSRLSDRTQLQRLEKHVALQRSVSAGDKD